MDLKIPTPAQNGLASEVKNLKRPEWNWSPLLLPDFPAAGGIHHTCATRDDTCATRDARGDKSPAPPGGLLDVFL